MFFKFLVRLLIPPHILFNYMREGLQIVTNNFFPVLVMNSFFLVTVFLTYFSFMFLVFELAYEREIQNILLGFMGIPVISFFFCSLIRFHYGLVRKSKIKMDIFLIDYKKYFHIFLLFNIYYALYNLAFKAIFDFDELEGINKLRAILGISLFFWILVRLIFSPFFVIEKGYSTRRAMKSSFLLTSGRTIKTIVLLFLCLVIFGGVFFGFGYLVFETSRLAYKTIKLNPDFSIAILWILGFTVVAILSLVAVSLSFSLLNIAFVMSYDIYLKNRFSRKKKLIYEVAIETKRKLEDSGFFQPIEEEVKKDNL